MAKSDDLFLYVGREPRPLEKSAALSTSEAKPPDDVLIELRGAGYHTDATRLLSVATEQVGLRYIPMFADDVASKAAAFSATVRSRSHEVLQVSLTDMAAAVVLEHARRHADELAILYVSGFEKEYGGTDLALEAAAYLLHNGITSVRDRK